MLWWALTKGYGSGTLRKHSRSIVRITAERSIPDFWLAPTCLPVSNLAPSCFPSANALWMLWAALASNLSTNISQYAVDALSCMVLRLPPTCLQLGPPVSARVLWVFWAAQLILHLCPPCLPLVSDCLPVCSGCSALFPDCLHGYFGCSVPHEPALVSPLSPTVSK